METKKKKNAAPSLLQEPLVLNLRSEDEEEEGERSERRVWQRARLRLLQRPLCVAGAVMVWTAVVVAMLVMVDVVFAVSGDAFPFCQQPRRLQSSSRLIVAGAGGGAARGRVSYSEDEAVDAFWLVVFLPSSVVFVFSAIFLFAGISVVYVAPERHSCLKVVENDCCAAKRGSVRCLATLNLFFMATFVLFSVIMGCFALSLGTSCSTTLFWCYEVACWGLIVLLGATAFLLHRKVAVHMEIVYDTLHEKSVELLEAVAIMPDVEGCVLSTPKLQSLGTYSLTGCSTNVKPPP